ncbi:MAG: excinuclease ABC subunit UvrB [Candidatus Woesearchaeota archaeon]
MRFELSSPFEPAGGQPEAIERLSKNYAKGAKEQTLLGITGSGKTFVMANVIERLQRPTIIIAHNKTLAAQLYQELKGLFPKNRVEYFISYYDYYQPESYIATSDTYIEKEATINEEIEKMRLHTTSSLMSREDVIVVASISCIYGLGNPADFLALAQKVEQRGQLEREGFITRLVEMQYERADPLEAGRFRVRGDTIDIIPGYDDTIIRIELFGDEVDRISEIDPVTMERIVELDEITIYPAKQYVVPEEKMQAAIKGIRQELSQRLTELPALEAQRLKQRTEFDLEMIEEMGYCNGIENYSRYFDGRSVGEPPFVLLDYFPDDYLMIIDESHQTIPQARAMYRGDKSRKDALVEYGFRLPCAYDNRPLRFEEFESKFDKVLYVSATPADYETQRSDDTVELIIRPTGLLDPTVDIRPIEGQVTDLIQEIEHTVSNGDRVLVTTLTKRMAEDLTNYLSGANIRVRYLHSDIESLDRIELIRQLRAGEFDVLVGINLLREGLDIPEVSLVAVLDADKEGFLRDTRSLIQTMGRAARNVNGRVILYADRETDSIKRAVAIVRERRRHQEAFNTEHGITPVTIRKAITDKKREIRGTKHLADEDLEKTIADIDAQMRLAAENLDFEKAIELREHLKALQDEYAKRS